MIKGLDRPMFRNPNAPQFTGLEAYQGTMGSRNMPMNGIMGFADGGIVDELQSKRIADAYSQIESSDFIKNRLAEAKAYEDEAFRLREMGASEAKVQELLNARDAVTSTLTQMQPFRMLETSDPYSMIRSRVEESDDSGFLGIGETSGEESARMLSEARDITADLAPSMGSLNERLVELQKDPAAMRSIAKDPSAKALYEADVERVKSFQDFLKEPDIQREGLDQVAAESIRQNPETAQAANDIAEQTDKADNPYTLALNAAGSKGTGDPNKDAEAVNTMVADIASGAGLEITPEEVDVKNTPHNAIALMLAGFKMMQTKGTVGEAIGAGGEAGVSYLANVAEKEAERAKDLREAAIKAEGTANDTTDIRNAQYMKTTLGKFFPDATDSAFFDLARQSTQADPELMVSKMSSEMIGIDPGVARNYSYMVVNTDIARRLGVDDPIVGVDRSGIGYTFGDINALTSVEGSKFDNAAEAASALGIRYIPLSDIYKTTMSVQQNAAE